MEGREQVKEALIKEAEKHGLHPGDKGTHLRPPQRS